MWDLIDKVLELGVTIMIMAFAIYLVGAFLGIDVPAIIDSALKA